MRCWPVGRPSAWSGWSSLKRKIRVSQETFVLEWRRVLRQLRESRKMGRGVVDSGMCSGSERSLREASESVPMW